MRNYVVMIAFALISATAFIACDKDDDDMNNKTEVTMSGDLFSPASLQIMTGTTVTWRNNDDDVHTVTANDGSFDSGDIDPGETFTRTFSSTATIAYHCMHHSGMTGTVVVVAN